MTLSDIPIRDPFILPHDGRYYLFSRYGSERKFGCYLSDDLTHWSEPTVCFDPPTGFWGTTDYWAPEVHAYNDRFYLFATFKAEGHMRAVQVLAADKPEGPYSVWSCPLTPNDWMALDGTLYVENGVPYMIFCHEWVQVKDGEMCAVPLSADLKHTVGPIRRLFSASEAPWSSDKLHGGYITDGPFMHRCADGKLIMIWSSFDENGYVEAVAVSDNGRLDGHWSHCAEPWFRCDGGHGMLFSAHDGRQYFTMHFPNSPGGAERAVLYTVEETPQEPYLRIVNTPDR